MKQARVLVNNIIAGYLEQQDSLHYRFSYVENYSGPAVSLTMPVKNKQYEFDKFPSFFEGLLPEGVMLEALLKKCKLDKQDYFAQLICIGQDMVGAVTVEAVL